MTDTLTPSTLTSVPTLSLATADADPTHFADRLGGSFERFGFAVVEDHGIDPALIADAWAVTAEFFARPDADKRAFYTEALAGQRGYTPFRTEIAKGAATHDLKEFWHVGRTLAPGQNAPGLPTNLWPDEPARFRAVLERLYAEFDRVGLRLLSAIARWLELDPRWFDNRVNVGNSILRLLHYPPIPLDAEGERAGAHEDINLITLLLGAEEAGLELRDRETGAWLAVDPPGRRAGGERRRHAAAADQRPAAVDEPPRRQSAAGAARQPALFHAVLSALQLGRADRDPARLRERRAAGPLPRPDHGRRLSAPAAGGDRAY